MEIGDKYGRLTCISKETNGKKNYYLFKCECGNTKYIAAYNVRKGNTKSCGCLSKERPHHLTHGISHTRLDKCYKSMISRCYRKTDDAYIDYGARGITVCEEWRLDRTKFFAWALKNGYEEHLTIDRIDVNGNYEPNNCRWATYREQGNNKRNNVIIEYEGKRYTVAEYSRLKGISYNKAYRMVRRGVLKRV